MKPQSLRALALLLPALLGACGDGQPPPTADPSPPGQLTAAELTTEPAAPALELDWEALIPEDWRPEKLLAEYNVEELKDDDPRAQELMSKLEALWKQAPVVKELDGKRVKLPGFVVPVDMDAQRIGEFLLVPYQGACIHVPPPPPNQTVYVVTAKGREYAGRLFDTVWVTGTLRVEAFSSELGDAGYRMEATQVEHYE